MNRAVSLAISLAFLGWEADALATKGLFSFSCGSQMYLCPGLTQDTSCLDEVTTDFVTMTESECAKMIKQVNSGAQPTCANGEVMSGHVEYGCQEAEGQSFPFGGDQYNCGCNAGFCGLETCGGGITHGDPHFKTHDGTQYDFHGECDLVMARSKSLKSGFDLDVHGRTKDMGGWSLVSNAAVRIGDDIFEVQNDGTHYLNGVPDVAFPIFLAGQHNVHTIVEAVKSGSEDPEEKYRTWYIIDIHEGKNKVFIMRFKDVLKIGVDAHLHDTVGMLGTPMKAGLVGRDQQTVFEDADEMGMEWQVRDTEPMLFHEIRAPQYPQRCIIPDATARRLRYSERSVREAAEACAGVDEDMVKNCIDDVVLTGNKYVAHAYAGL